MSCNEIPTPRWAVRRDDVHASTVLLAGPWRVESPRGIDLYRTWSQRTAFELANCLASVEDLLVRINALEELRVIARPLEVVR